MAPIQTITSSPSQSMTIVLPDGSSFAMTITFVPLQSGWFITSLTYKSFTLQGFRISNSPNMLQQYRNQIPFGLACYSTADREPSLQYDFSSGNSVIYLMSAAEVTQYEDYLIGAT